MIISVASGKGGTGKTTIATNLAYALGSDVQLLDCDVEEPNAHLLLNPSIETSEPVYSWIPQINTDKCNFCGKCADICRFNAIVVLANNVLIFPQLCHDCGGCTLVCPEFAIFSGQRELGVIEEGRKNGISFCHGRLKIGESMSPPLIRQVKNYQKDRQTIIIDAPPGTSCSVVTTIKGSDFVLLVTEPTPFGMYDLQLAVETVRALKIPCGLVINRSDIGDDRITCFANAEGLPVLLEIPFDRSIAELYAQGRLFTENQSVWQEKFLAMHQAIADIVAEKETVT